MQTAEAISARKPKPIPTRSLIAAAARVYRASSALGNLILGARSVDSVRFQILIEQLNSQVEHLDALIHALEARERRAPGRLPIRTLVVRSARIRHMVNALNDLAFSAEQFDGYTVGTRIEQLERDVAHLEGTIHRMEPTGAKS